MGITDKTRKMLWSQSGGRCAICKGTLIVDATADDDESIVGDECHIISPRTNGPRHDPNYPSEKLDSSENLLLLCRVDHKMVDDQCETFTADILRTMKSNHERWISEKLADKGGVQSRPTPRLRRKKENIPALLVRITEGKELLDLVYGAHSSMVDYPKLEDQGEVDLVSGFLQEAVEWGEILPELGPGDQVTAAHSLDGAIRDLDAAGFWVFGAVEHAVVEGGVEEPSDWRNVILRVARTDDENIRSGKPKDLLEEEDPSPTNEFESDEPD